MTAPDEQELVIVADAVLTPDQIWEPGFVRVAGDQIVAAGEAEPSVIDLHQADAVLHGQTLVPGFVDVHSHGGAGSDFPSGDLEAVREVVQGHLAHGTTSMMASLVTASLDDLELRVASLAPLVADGELLGIHLEGPWLSPTFKGAHDPNLLRAPVVSEIDRILEAGQGAVRMVTIAPELPGGLEAVAHLARAGVIAAVGHTDADYKTAKAAVDAGARAATHLFNAERALHHREPGPVAALLEDDRVWIELIADGVHVHPGALRLAASRAGDRTVLVTDAMAAAAAPDGDYILGSLDVSVRDGVARLVSNGAIAGSTLTLDAAVRFAVREVGLALPDAIRAATASPAAMVGRSDLGEIAAGKRADLVALDSDLQVTRVMQSGRWVA